VIVYALRYWRHYLIGKKFKLKTDHSGLQHIFTQSDLNVRQRCCSKVLSEYDFEITYIKGTINRVANALIHETPHFLTNTPKDESSRKYFSIIDL
jgi:hypothetical protein